MPTDLAPPVARTYSPAVVLYWCTFLVVGLSLSILGPALSELRDRSGTDLGGIGVLFVGQSAGYIVGSLIGGRMLDRFDGHHVFAGALMVVGAGLAVVPELGGLSALFGVFVVVGLGTATVDVGANAMLLWETGGGGGRAMNVLHLCFGFGALSAPLLVYAGLGVATRSAAAISVLCGVVALRVPAPIAPPVAEEQEGSPGPRLLALLALFFFLYVGLELGFAGWIHTYGEEIQFSALAATWLTAVFWIGFTTGRLLSSIAAHRFRPKHVLIGACSATVAGAAFMVVGDGRTAPVWIGTALFGLATAPQFPTMFNYLERRIHVSGYAASWFVGAAGLGGLVFPWTIGRVIDASDVSALPWVILVLALANVGSFALSNRRLGG